MIVTCNHCGNIINRKPSILKKNKNNFCSKKCEGLFRYKHYDINILNEISTLYFISMFGLKKISKKIYISKSQIYRICQKYNIILRDRETAIKLTNKKLENSPAWKGGFRKANKYIFKKIKNHPRSNNGYIQEHILIMEKYIRRKLKYYGKNHKDNEIVHHIDFDTTNNNISNLLLVKNNIEHRKLHSIINKIAIEKLIHNDNIYEVTKNAIKKIK